MEITNKLLYAAHSPGFSDCGDHIIGIIRRVDFTVHHKMVDPAGSVQAVVHHVDLPGSGVMDGAGSTGNRGGSGADRSFILL